MSKILRDLEPEDVGTSIRVPYTNIEGVLEEFDLDYEDEVRIIVGGSIYYLPGDYPVVESIDYSEYDPAVLLGVVDPWSPL